MTDQRHGQKVIGRYPDVTSKLVELVVSLSVESEELHKVKKKEKKKNTMSILASLCGMNVHDLIQDLLSAWARSD